jgi:hypothetical protein
MANGTLAASQIEMESQSGTGVTTIVPPATNTDRTLTLPDNSGTVLTTATPGVPVDGPAVIATRSSGGTQTISAGVWTKLLFPDESYDTNNNFASSTFTPTVAGFYWVRVAAAQVTAGTQLGIYKSGSLYSGQNAGSGSGDWLEVNALVYCNGTTDTLEGWAFAPSGMNFIQISILCQFQAALIRSAA